MNVYRGSVSGTGTAGGRGDSGAGYVAASESCRDFDSSNSQFASATASRVLNAAFSGACSTNHRRWNRAANQSPACFQRRKRSLLKVPNTFRLGS